MSHTQLHREYITSSEMYSLHLTHPKWTHTRSSGSARSNPCYSARGAVGGSVPCSRTPQSWYWRRILPPPTIPAGPEIRTHNLLLTSPIYIYIYIYIKHTHIHAPRTLPSKQSMCFKKRWPCYMIGSFNKGVWPVKKVKSPLSRLQRASLRPYRGKQPMTHVLHVLPPPYGTGWLQ